MRKPLLVLIAAAVLTGCTVGPEYVRPEPGMPSRFDQATAEAAAQPAQTQVWEAFGDAELDALIERALDANTTIAQAAARFEETLALRGLIPYSWFPTINASADAERSDPSGEDPFLPTDQTRTDTYRAGFDASWEIDLFGSLRNQSSAVRRRTEANAAELAQVRLSIVAETAQSFFALRGARARQRLHESNLAKLGESVELVATLESHGRSTALDVARIRAQRSALAAQQAQLDADVVRHEQRLAVLTAQPVAQLRQQLDPQAALPPLPALVTLGTPQQWLQRRPDVRAAERRLAAAYSDVGTETAEFFPKLNLFGSFGWTAQGFGDLGSGSAERWAWGPSLSWSFLDAGRVRQRVKAAEARADGARAAFDETVLRALEETENALAGYRAANRAAGELDDAARAAGEAAQLATLRFEAGVDDALSLLDAERTRIDFEARAVEAGVARATALAQLYKALAGDFAALGEPAEVQARLP
ncbi:MAG: TolC family protein [Chiayiivirga sp.]|jgi:multidrug efflux system outer membrane protein|uniref:efflux transporter outer membrane subunit n=1 Tax=Chiayiivirga sp. TaxID=2041042 RepID=UPI0025C3695D|nr:TolC family protein [Chiayiivirga sp.]MCI1709931.1 TolC family protein [Chiayiivirga sp.]MCI1730355.1 TolC family protein [Chiayiivirga sp.]